MKAYYDLSKRPATFDFVTFLVTAKTLGATEVVFDISKGFQKKKFSQDVARLMYENVLQPACDLWGVPFSEGLDGDFSPGHHVTDLINAYEHSGSLAQPVFNGKKGHKYTVTIRDSIRNEQRNSNRSNWERFAKEIGAYVIEDAYKKPLSLIERFSLYNGAEMNFFVSNGPGVLCLYSKMPCVFFSPKSADNTWPINSGFQLPFRTEKQKIVWADDTYENIRASL